MLRRMDPQVLTIVGGVIFVGVGVVASTVGGAIGAALFRRSAPPPSGGLPPASLPPAGLPPGYSRPVSHPACPRVGGRRLRARRRQPISRRCRPRRPMRRSTRLPGPTVARPARRPARARRSAFVAARAARRVLTPQTSLRLHSVLSRSPCRSRPTVNRKSRTCSMKTGRSRRRPSFPVRRTSRPRTSTPRRRRSRSVLGRVRARARVDEALGHGARVEVARREVVRRRQAQRLGQLRRSPHPHGAAQQGRDHLGRRAGRHAACSPTSTSIAR